MGCVGGVIDPGFVDRLKKLPPRIRRLFDERRDSLKAVASRLTLVVLSWTQFQNSLVSYRAGLDASHAGDQTLSKLLDGLSDQIHQHGKTGIAGLGELVSAETDNNRDLHEAILADGEGRLAMSVGRDQPERTNWAPKKEVPGLFGQKTDDEAEEGRGREISPALLFDVLRRSFSLRVPLPTG